MIFHSIAFTHLYWSRGGLHLHTVGTELNSCRCFPPDLYLGRTRTAEKETDIGQDRITNYVHVAFAALPVIPLMPARPHQADFCTMLDANTPAYIHFVDTSLVCLP